MLNSKTRSELKQRNLRPVKHRGQNFLISPGVIKEIIYRAQVKTGETILEVGPGTGNLTQALLNAGANVIAVEKDEELVRLLNSKFQSPNDKQIPNAKLQITKEDILRFDETAIKKPYRVIANIPYYLTGKLIQKFLLSPQPPREMILMVQKEVGERITARPPKANYLSALVGFLARAEILLRVSKENFWPKPKVDSAMVKIVPRSISESIDVNEFIIFLRKVFKQPRQTLFNNLVKNGFDKTAMEKLFQDFNFGKKIRPQNLNQQQLLELFLKTLRS